MQSVSKFSIFVIPRNRLNALEYIIYELNKLYIISIKIIKIKKNGILINPKVNRIPHRIFLLL